MSTENEVARLNKLVKALTKKCEEIAGHNSDLADSLRRVMAEANRLQPVEQQFHDINVLNLQDEGIRQALIALGWKPPPSTANGK